MLAIGLAVLAALHLTSALIDRAPFGSGTRWTAYAGALALAVAGFLGGAVSVDGVRVVELVSSPWR